MTSIKPPDGRSPAGAAGSATSSTRELEGPERAGESYRETLAGTGPAGAARASAAQNAVGAASADPVAQLAQAVRAGSVSPQQALDHLVERAVAGMARRLTETQRAELTAVLREAMQSDPALCELREAIGRS
jgi:hypothetical protein